MYMEALRRAISEKGGEEFDFDDDGDYISLNYGFQITEDLKIEEALGYVSTNIDEIETLALQLAENPVTQKITRVEGWIKMAEEAYEAALRQALEELTEVHQDAFSFV